MATIQHLKAKKRDGAGRAVARNLRKAGKVPGVIYGAKQDNYGVEMEAIEIKNLLARSVSKNVLVRLDIEGAREQDKLALIQEVQHHPLKGTIMHVDFHAVKEDEKFTTHVRVELTGTALGVTKGGLLDLLLHSIDVRCLPLALPDIIKVDVSGLDIGQSIHVADLALPDGVEAVTHGDVVIAVVQEIAAGKSEAAAEAPAAAAAAKTAPAAKGAPAAKTAPAKAAPAAKTAKAKK